MDEEEDCASDCPICFERFEETGDRSSRVLPCGGIICEKCITELIEDNAIDCPECGSQHEVENGVISFPKKVTAPVHSEPDATTGDTSQTSEQPGTTGSGTVPAEGDGEEGSGEAEEEMCKEHGKHPSIYCKDPYCQKAILLLQRDHPDQDDVVDAEDEEVETLFTRLDSVLKLLTVLKRKIISAKRDIEQKNKTCLQRMKSKQQEMVNTLPAKEEILSLIRKRFQELENGASDQMTKLNTNIDNEVTAVDERLTMLDSIKETTHTTNFSHADITNRLETIKSIEAQVQSNVSDALTLKYLEYHEKPATKDTLKRLCNQLKEKDFSAKLAVAEDVESLCGYLRQRETCVHLTIEDDADDDDVIIVDVQIPRKAPEDRPTQFGSCPYSGMNYFYVILNVQ